MTYTPTTEILVPEPVIEPAIPTSDADVDDYDEKDAANDNQPKEIITIQMSLGCFQRARAEHAALQVSSIPRSSTIRSARWSSM